MAFTIDDLEGEVTRLEKLGVIVKKVRTNALTAKRFSFLTDLDGLPIIELYEL